MFLLDLLELGVMYVKGPDLARNCPKWARNGLGCARKGLSG